MLSSVNYVSLSFRLGSMMCHTFLLRERESGGELGQMQGATVGASRERNYL